MHGGPARFPSDPWGRAGQGGVSGQLKPGTIWDLRPSTSQFLEDSTLSREKSASLRQT